MFNKSKGITNKILLLSSYIPLYLVIVIQNLFFTINDIYTKGNFKLYVLGNWSLFKEHVLSVYYTEIFIMFFFIVLSVILFVILSGIIKNSYSINESTSFTIKVSGINDKNHEYLTSYIAVYILPFITLDLTTFSGLAQLILLFYFIGYIYLKYEMIYINPILNIFFHLNVYDIYFTLDDEEDEDTTKMDKVVECHSAVLLTSKDKKHLTNENLRVSGKSLLFDISKIKK